MITDECFDGKLDECWSRVAIGDVDPHCGFRQVEDVETEKNL